MTADTIFALSSGRPPAAIAVVRISGPAALGAATTLAGTLPPPRVAGVRRLRGADGETLDQALVLSFPGPASANGEDLVELHLHGGRAVVAAVSAALMGLGLRPAVAGEFTRRAIAHGRMDLAQAEGLADLLQAETEAQRRSAQASVEGAVGRHIGAWRDRVIALSARVEARIDFSDEGDVAATDPSLRVEIGRLVAEMRRVLDGPTVERLRDGVRIVIAGPPNAGKSTLLNLLVEREAAIVSDIAGTTRDRIEAPVIRQGVAYVITDTAGLRGEGADAIEAIGINLAERAMRDADLVLWLGDEDALGGAAPTIEVHARADLAERRRIPAGRVAIARDDPESVAALWRTIAERAEEMLPRPDQLALNQRQHRLCLDALEALTMASVTDDWILMAEGLRAAITDLAGVTGHSATDLMLDELFQRFCIGK